MNKPVKKILTLSTLLIAGMQLINEYTDVCISPIHPSKEDKTFFWKDLKINYAEKGNANNPPLLLLHHLYPTSSKEEWRHIDDTLASKFHIFELDLPGCGKSSKPNITYINYMYVELINDFIKKMIGKKTSICAAAFSSSFTFMTARIYPEIIDKIIVIHPTNIEELYTTVSKESKIKEKILEIPIIGTFLYNCMMSKSAISDCHKYKYYYNEKNISEHMIDISYFNAHYKHSSGKYLLGSILANYTNINIIHALPKIHKEIYLIGNENAKKTFQEYKKYNENIYPIYVSHCGLLPQLEIPETISDKIIQIFFKDSSPRSIKNN